MPKKPDGDKLTGFVAALAVAAVVFAAVILAVLVFGYKFFMG